MKRKNVRLPEGDDGHTIANMNVEGMPWYHEEKPEAEAESGEQMTKQQVRLYTMGALRAGLLVVGVFSVALILFVLFCLYVWF